MFAGANVGINILYEMFTKLKLSSGTGLCKFKPMYMSKW